MVLEHLQQTLSSPYLRDAQIVTDNIDQDKCEFQTGILWYGPTTSHQSVLKKKGVPPFARTRLNHTDMTEKETRQTQKDENSVIPLT